MSPLRASVYQSESNVALEERMFPSSEKLKVKSPPHCMSMISLYSLPLSPIRKPQCLRNANNTCGGMARAGVTSAAVSLRAPRGDLSRDTAGQQGSHCGCSKCAACLCFSEAVALLCSDCAGMSVFFKLMVWLVHSATKTWL